MSCQNSFLKVFVFLLCACVFCLHVGRCTTDAPGVQLEENVGAHGSGLKMIISCYVDAENQTWVLCDRSKGS